jgi:hypothetical protein
VNATADTIVLDTDIVSRLLRGTLTEDLAARLIPSRPGAWELPAAKM